MVRGDVEVCGNCGDGKGWHIWRPRSHPEGVWFACADCNDNAEKPKPDLCEGCGETEPFCECELESR